MDEQSLRRPSANERQNPGRPRGTLAEHPDRIALWAFLLAVVAMIAGAASADAASSGGTGFGGGSGGAGPCADAELGDRTLRQGDCGDDVETLNWILGSKDYGKVPLGEKFETATTAAVREFERNAGIRANGVVERQTTSALVNSMPSQVATWYGPGFWGNKTACGQRLARRTVGVAHKTLPCGSRVVLRYQGRYLRTRVIDRGPFTNGAKWDLTQRAARMLGLDTTDEIRVAKLAK